MIEELRNALHGLYDIEAPIGRRGDVLCVPRAEATAGPARRDQGSPPRPCARRAPSRGSPTPTSCQSLRGRDRRVRVLCDGTRRGGTLSRRVTTRGPLDAFEAGRLLREIGDALGYARARGLGLRRKFLARGAPWLGAEAPRLAQRPARTGRAGAGRRFLCGRPLERGGMEGVSRRSFELRVRAPDRGQSTPRARARAARRADHRGQRRSRRVPPIAGMAALARRRQARLTGCKQHAPRHR